MAVVSTEDRPADPCQKGPSQPTLSGMPAKSGRNDEDLVRLDGGAATDSLAPSISGLYASQLRSPLANAKSCEKRLRRFDRFGLPTVRRPSAGSAEGGAGRCGR